MSAITPLAPGLHRFAARHPEWHPRGFDEVVSYVVEDELGTLLVDPLIADADTAALDEVVHGTVRIAITIPYHVRSAERLAERYDAAIHGDPRCATRLGDTRRFRPARAGDELPGGARFHAIGSPRRAELPLELPSVDAIAFGDAVLEVGGVLRVWEEPPMPGTNRERWYRERFLPTLAALADLGRRRVLVTHGRAVLDDGPAALRDALCARPFTRRET